MSKLEAKIRMVGAGAVFLGDLGLEEHPLEAVKLLVEELHPISENTILIEEQDERWRDMHVVWCIRALRYLTGRDVTAKTTHVFADNEEENSRKHFLTKSNSSEVTFFGVWMSREITYIAPEDAQMKIIEDWQRWLKRDAPTYQFPEANGNFNTWYF